MSEGSDHALEAPHGGAPPSMIELFDRLGRYEGTPEQFLFHLLQTQSRASGAKAGAILRVTEEGNAEAVAMYPRLAGRTTAPVWLAQAAELAAEVISSGETTIRALHGPGDLYGQEAREHLVLIPLTGARGIRGLAVFLLDAGNLPPMDQRIERLELTVAFMHLHEMRLTLQNRQNDLGRLRVSMDTLAAVNTHDRFTGAAMALCNEMATRWQCERVSVGVLVGRYVQVKAVSNTEKFSRKMKLVQDIEAAMEECVDQDLAILAPAPQEASYVSRAGTELARRHGPSSVISLPLRRGGKPVAVVTAERPADRPFEIQQIESMRLTCELCTSRLMDLHLHDRWFGAKLAGGLRKGLAAAVGPRHTWLKVAGIAICAFLAFMVFARGDYTADANFALEAKVRQVVLAPFEGILKAVNVEIGDPVSADKTVLAVLDTAELREQLAASQVERLQALKSAAEAMRDGETVKAQIARQEARKAEANIRLLQGRIRRASVRSPVSGTVVEGDLKRHVGRRVRLGDPLFHVAPLDSLRAQLYVSEDQIADVRVGQEGRMAVLSYPGQHFPFVVERINPVAEVVERKNVFEVRVRLLQTEKWMRPGMAGVARISIDRRPYAYIWSRRLVNWVRMKLWW